ncbi:hypothetical protein WJX81_005150 [Elliptochloris bilobata]|uniref:glutamine--tRNA ligase n=1 Tax=Elliptochloris bilobata TaxID=381761 RepID=A0AAW1RHV5_9CHLO
MAREEQELDAEKLMSSIGLVERTMKETMKNKKLRNELVAVIREAGAEKGCEKACGDLLYEVAVKYPKEAALDNRPAFLRAYVMTAKVKNKLQLDAALTYLAKRGPQPLEPEALNEAAGVGVVVTPEEVATAVGAEVAANEEKLRTERYRFNPGAVLAELKKRLKWADGAAVKKELDVQVAALLGPKTEADLAKPEKKKKEPRAPKPVAAVLEAGPAANGAPDTEDAAEQDPYAFLPKPAENNKVHTTVTFSDGRVMSIANTGEQLAAHLAATGGRVVTRFPPEPNGYLHIGHAKAMFVDFGMAEQYGGDCYLRYDDTNPEAEKMEFIEHIRDIVAWLGWKPAKVTYSSDYFAQLHELAVQLIRSGHAYVDHQTPDDMKASREAREPSPWRDRPVEESLRLFSDMRRGLMDEGSATLRMKQDVRNENFNMFDLVAYRMKYAPHPHAGPGWCIYPSYDFTHCVVDSLENISHSLCTLEFESRRASYYWLLEVLGLYKAVVWEYARLSITHNLLSKRRLARLVSDGHVHGWDDPRLLTLAGLRRRGVAPEALRAFCREGGISRNAAEAHLHKLEHHIRAVADVTAPRAMAVLRPLRLVLTNLAADHREEVAAKVFPGRSEDTYAAPLTRVVYIEQDDFREEDSRGYFGLAPGKSVMLKYAGTTRCTGCRKEGGRVVEVQAEYARLQEGVKAPKGVLHWVAEPEPDAAPPALEARLYSTLFRSQSPAELGDEWLADLNPESLTTVAGAMAGPALAGAKPGDCFQLERLGYFCVDPDSAPGRLVLNRTCMLKDSFATERKAPAKGRCWSVS